MGNIQTVGPNEALIVSGGLCRPSKKQIIVGGWCWTTWMLTNIQRISLQVMTVNPRCEHVQSSHGVPVTLTGVVHCKIMSTPEFLPLAAEQFLGKSVDHIKSVILHTVEGHMRAVIGTQTVEDICKHRQELASMIREATTKDLSRMGIDIMSLTIKEIKDDVEYMNSAGKKTASLVKQNAAVTAVKEENKAAQAEANYEMLKEEDELKYKSELAEQQHELDAAKSEINEEAGRLKAEATKAYDLKMASLQKGIKEIEMNVKNIEYDGLIDIKKKETDKRKAELEIELDLPTKSEIYEMEKQVEAKLATQKSELESEEYHLRKKGEAEAIATSIKGKAEAIGMKQVAQARKEFKEAAVLFEVLKVLPEIAAEIASPLSKFEEIVLISEGEAKDATNDKKVSSDKSMLKTTGTFAAEAAKISSAVPMAVKAVGGSDRTSTSLIGSLMQLQKTANH